MGVSLVANAISLSAAVASSHGLPKRLRHRSLERSALGRYGLALAPEPQWLRQLSLRRYDGAIRPDAQAPKALKATPDEAFGPVQAFA
jgi:hypothetical protein